MGLLRLAGARAARGVQELGEADVGDARRVLADQVHVGVEQSGVHGLAVLAQHCVRGTHTHTHKHNHTHIKTHTHKHNHTLT